MLTRNITLLSITLLTLVTLGYAMSNENQSRFQLIPIDWNKSDPRWKEFAQQYLEKMQQVGQGTPAAKLPGYKFDRVLVEVKSPLISKFISNYRIYTDKYSTFVFASDGEVIDLTKYWGGAVGDDPYYRNPQFSNFIKKQNIQINDETGAVEIIELIEDIYREPFDEPNWKHKVSKNNEIWQVVNTYFGTASVLAPPVWEIVTDGQNHIIEVRQRDTMFRR